MKLTSLILLLLCCNLQAQTSLQGGSLIGGGMGDGLYAYEKKLGLVAAYRSNYGVSMTGGTNVYAWADLTGNGFNLYQPVSARQPVYHPGLGILDSTGNVTTNATIFFNGSALVSDNLAALFSGVGKPITIVTFSVDTAGGAGTAATAAFCWLGRTNVTASTVEQRKNSTTTYILAENSDTNSATAAITSPNTTATTNWLIQTSTYNGTNGMVYINRAKGVLTALDHSVVPTTLNQFSVGGVKTNINLYVRFWTGGISEVQVYTNSFSNDGTQLTNIINSVRGRWNLTNPNN